jgi:uncharacterized phage protein (TIGR01671 family)
MLSSKRGAAILQVLLVAAVLAGLSVLLLRASLSRASSSHQTRRTVSSQLEIDSCMAEINQLFAIKSADSFTALITGTSEVQTMREILFRAKTADENEWIYGDIFHSGAYPKIMRIHDYKNRVNYAVNPETLGQFTGLTDNNGVKIFEGDIVRLYGDKDTDTKCVNYKALVVFVYGGFCAIDGTLKDYAVCRFDFTSSLNCEVIGNIYDNPKLIKEDN